MNLPNYFLADLPPEATLNATVIADACQTLKHNREHYLRDRSTAALMRTLTDLAQSWLDPDYTFRRFALANALEKTGFSPQTLAVGLDSLFRQITAENLERLLVQDLGHLRRLDDFSSPRNEQEAGRAALARGPELLAHIAAGNIVTSAISSLLLGLLVRSAQFMKCASGTSFLVRLFAHSLYQNDPKLGACLEVAEWPGGTAALETTLFQEVDCLTAAGSDETLAAIRQTLPARVRFLGYGHKVSFGYIAQDALAGANVARVVARAGAETIAWDQLGCLSPHLFYVERGGHVSGEEFGRLLAEQLSRSETEQPRGRVAANIAAEIASRRAFYDVRAAYSPETKVWASPESTAWTVVYDSDPHFQFSCLHRFVHVKSVQNWREAVQSADGIRGKVSTIGLEASDELSPEIAKGFAQWGAARICPLGEMQRPPLGWRHDGRPSLGELVTWTDWERRDA